MLNIGSVCQERIKLAGTDGKGVCNMFRCAIHRTANSILVLYSMYQLYNGNHSANFIEVALNTQPFKQMVVHGTHL